MKNKAVVQFVILAVVSLVAAVLVFFAGGIAGYHWREALGGGKAGMPEEIIFVSRYGFLIPLVCCLASIVFAVVAMKKDLEQSVLWKIFTVIVTVELIGVPIIYLLAFWPAMMITYRLM